MSMIPLSLSLNYWEEFKIQPFDIEFLYNFLLEIEIPQTSIELAKALIKERIRIEQNSLVEQRDAPSNTYLPKNQYEIGQTISFPLNNWEKGQVIGTREGFNPDYPAFNVIEVEFEEGIRKEFASNFPDHKLNTPLEINKDDPSLNSDYVINKYLKEITALLNDYLESNDDLIQIAGKWFPRALFVDIGPGYLNLAEAVLEVEEGGPLTTNAILGQIEFPSDVNSKLTEFSFNFALQEDPRFDEVGPAGETLWFLHRLEPDEVQKSPQFLQFSSTPAQTNNTFKMDFSNLIFDEHEISQQQTDLINEITISLIYPHWRSGSLPLTPQMSQLFPTAYEAPRVLFTFVDEGTGKKFPGWIVRPEKYITGLREYYLENELIPGSLINIKKGEKPGEVLLSLSKKRQVREWIKTALVSADGKVVFALLKQLVSHTYDERLAIAIPDLVSLDELWKKNINLKTPMDQTIHYCLRDLTKLNPQGQVHLQELYAAVNVIRRCPPGLILKTLAENTWAEHLGDMYFKLSDQTVQKEKDA